MENVQTETITTPEATPAPVTAQPQATETKPAQEPAKTGAENAAKPSGTTPPKEPADFFRQREAKREKKAQERVAELERERTELLAKLEKVKPVAEPAKDEPLFSLDDPDGSFKKMKEAATRDAVEAIKREQAEQQSQTKYVQTAESAEKFLLTRSHLKEDPNLANEIARVLDEKYAHLAAYQGGRDPMAAARLAYLDVCAAKGIVPDLDGFKLAKPDMSAGEGKSTSGVSPTAPGTGKRVFAKGEVKKYLDEVPAGSPEWRRRLDETDEAYREGRVKR